ncbi:MAG TPA: DUF1800 family protein, partial [Candidatus Acidoferrum sp.]
MRLQKFRSPGFRIGFPGTPFRLSSMATTPKSFLALILSCACTLSLGDFQLVAAFPAARTPTGATERNKDKKPKQDPALKGLPIAELSADEAILHALNRLAYGPRPGEIERVKQMGLAKWIERQLNPNSIDDKAMEARLQDYPTLRMSTAKLIAEYPQPKPAEKQAEKRAQAQERQEQRRADASAANEKSSEREMPASETQGGSTDAQNATTSGESAPQPTAENPNAPAPMKESEMPPESAR